MKKTTWIAIIVGALIIIPVGWYLLSPLFIDITVSEALPTSVSVTAMQTEMASGDKGDADTKADTNEMTESNGIMEEPKDEPTAQMEQDLTSTPESAQPQVLARGTFYDLAHHGMGTAIILLLEDGSRILRFENFEVLNGPELHVYLTPINPVPNTVGAELENYLDLGGLKGNIGDQNYTIPSDLDLSSYRSVVIWCEPFRVPFNAASLEAP